MKITQRNYCTIFRLWSLVSTKFVTDLGRVREDNYVNIFSRLKILSYYHISDDIFFAGRFPRPLITTTRVMFQWPVVTISGITNRRIDPILPIFLIFWESRQKLKEIPWRIHQNLYRYREYICDKKIVGIRDKAWRSFIISSLDTDTCFSSQSSKIWRESAA